MGGDWVEWRRGGLRGMLVGSVIGCAAIGRRAGAM